MRTASATLLVASALALSLIAACGGETGGGSSAVDSGGVDCTTDADCASGVCVDGACVDDTDTGPEPDATDTGPTPDAAPDVALDAADVGADVADVDLDAEPDVDAGPEPGTIGAPCEGDLECDSGLCIRTSEGGVCTTLCSDSCPDGWECRLLANSEGDVIELCVPTPEVLCRPCIEDFDCDGLDNLCIPQSDGTFCGRYCEDDAACPDGFSCEDVFVGGESIGQCQPELGICGDCFDEDGDGHGAGPGCLGFDCDDLDPSAYEGAVELCDGWDDDCDEMVDEDFDFAVDPRNCGACGIACEAESAEGACVEGLCVVTECDPGTWDIDGAFENGCEYACVQNADTDGEELCNERDDDCDGMVDEDFDLTSDNENCGVCGEICALVGAETACRDSDCRIASCVEPFEDCNTLVDDGCEIDISADTDHCGGCDVRCDLDNATPACLEGACAIATCDEGWADCNDDPADGCEVDTTTSLAHCGGCERACAFDAAAAICAESVCSMGACEPGRGDCNVDTGDGCEVDLETTVAHCGACGAACDLANAAPACVDGGCEVAACLDTWADCNGVDPDGCEIDTATNVNHCGGCGTVCDLPRATAACSDGGCVIARCDDGWADCNGDPTDGCEVNITSSLSNCGACGTVCEYASAEALCVDGACRMGACDDRFGDCNGDPSDGCEESLRFNDDHCGACGDVCAPANASGACVEGSCNFFGCLGGYSNCNGDISDGCEVNTWESVGNCGGCGRLCALDNATETCSFGVCSLDACTDGYGNCNGDPSDGCETNVVDNNLHCGACNNRCDLAFSGGTGVCEGTSCAFRGCFDGVEDCNDDLTDGCETDIWSSDTDCGACGSVCELANGSSECRVGTCVLTACTDPWEDCDRDGSNGCEANLDADIETCGACGIRCAYTNAAARCDAGVCAFDGCDDGWVNLDGDVDGNGCEYACTPSPGFDDPDMGFADTNCDGVDGDASRSVFVAPPPIGNDGNPGTMERPKATVGAALALAGSDPRYDSVLVAQGVYNEAVVLRDGVGIYGGYTRVNAWRWTRDVAARAPSVVGAGRVGMSGSSIGSITYVQNLSIRSAGATSPGQSSYGVRLVSSPGVVLEHNVIEAGAGADGSNGSTGGVGAAGGTGGAGQQGCDGCSGAGYGGGGGAGFCSNSGGGGGRGGYGSSRGSAGSAGLWSSYTGSGYRGGGGSGGAGDGSSYCLSGCGSGGDPGGNGGTGLGGARGANGGGGSAGGSFSSTEWTGASGASGARGGHGGGGGGAGGGGGSDCCNDDRGGGGGGGGGGGCGGYGGNGGGGGGGSFGVALFNSNATVRNNEIRTADGGSGGNGGSGGAGGSGGGGGTAGARADDGDRGGYGGSGGSGGSGGCGGGGGGGASVGILRRTSSATVTGNGFVLGAAGGGGGGCGGAGGGGVRTTVWIQ